MPLIASIFSSFREFFQEKPGKAPCFSSEHEEMDAWGGIFIGGRPGWEDVSGGAGMPPVYSGDEIFMALSKIPNLSSKILFDFFRKYGMV